MDSQERWYLQNIGCEGENIVDVGANIGRLSQFFWDRGGPACRLTSIEPEPSNIESLERRILDVGSDRWKLEKCAVSSISGRVLMNAFDHSGDGRNSVVSDDGRFEVACERLEDLVRDATIVKVDIEGHEYQVLPTAVPTMTEVKVWALELHMMEGHPLQDTLAFLKRHGFALLGAGRRRDDPSGDWVSVDLDPRMTWDQLPGMPTAVDGVPGVFKMLHVIAKR